MRKNIFLLSIISLTSSLFVACGPKSKDTVSPEKILSNNSVVTSEVSADNLENIKKATLRVDYTDATTRLEKETQAGVVLTKDGYVLLKDMPKEDISKITDYNNKQYFIDYKVATDTKTGLTVYKLLTVEDMPSIEIGDSSSIYLDKEYTTFYSFAAQKQIEKFKMKKSSSLGYEPLEKLQQTVILRKNAPVVDYNGKLVGVQYLENGEDCIYPLHQLNFEVYKVNEFKSLKDITAPEKLHDKLSGIKAVLDSSGTKLVFDKPSKGVDYYNVYKKDTKTGAYIPLKTTDTEESFKWTYEKLTQKNVELLAAHTKSDFEDKVYYLVYSVDGRKSEPSDSIEIPKESTASPQSASVNYSYDNPVPAGTSFTVPYRFEFAGAIYSADITITYSDVKTKEDALKFISDRKIKLSEIGSQNEFLVAYEDYKFTNIKCSDSSKRIAEYNEIMPFETVAGDDDKGSGIGRLEDEFDGGFFYSVKGNLEIGKEYELKGYAVYSIPKDAKHPKIGIIKDKITYDHTNKHEQYSWFSLK